jgi:hypothetical protein
MEEGKIDNLLKLLEIVDSESEKAYKSFFEFTDVFTEKLIEEKRKLPYHINVIDELSANENANSRILSALLQYTDNGEYVLLKSFVKNVLSDFNIEVKHPYITTENLRIDLLVRENKEKDKYAIIFENKIHNAVQQKNQLARYIIKLRNEGFHDDEIYVVFMPPYMYEPDDCCWFEPQDVCKNCNCTQCYIDPSLNLKDKFKTRYKVVTFKNDIISWLKEHVVPNCRHKEVYLYTASMQYLDYLEGYFYLRTIDKEMNMRLDKIIIDHLKLEDCKDEKEKIIALEEKINDMSTLVQDMENKKKNIAHDWLKEICEKHSLNTTPNGDKIEYKLGMVIITLCTRQGNTPWWGVSCNEGFSIEDQKHIIEIIENHIPFGNKKYNNDGYLVWSDTSYENAENRFIKLIEVLSKNKKI